MLAKGEGCCGALLHHLGKEAGALAQARANVDVWTAEIERHGLEAILITASGCGTMIKDYGFLLRNDPAYAAKAARVSALAKDVTEFLGAPRSAGARQSARHDRSPIIPPVRCSMARRSTPCQSSS